jgi:thiol-disulfide isomerase/thioredoxin
MCETFARKRLIGPLIVAFALCAPMAHAVPPAATTSAQAIAWQPGGSDAEVDRAFAGARAAGKPVFLYWGAVWCPPCNQVKATLFHRADFIERSRAFVPVYVDGDSPGAQKVAARFHVQGYPTMVLFKPDGTEVTRLPGEVDPERYLLALGAALDAQVPVRELVARALRGEPLQPQQWRLLAYYSWDTDQARIFPEKELPARLAELAEHAPATLADVRDRLSLKALAAAVGTPAPPPKTISDGRQALEHLLQDPAAAAVQADLLTGYGSDFVTVLAPAGQERRALAARVDAALDRLTKSTALSKAVQVDALDARASLWKLMDGSSELTADQRRQVMVDIAHVVAATTDRYERQAVVPAAAHVLREAGLVQESDELLTMELPRAVAPYYHMLGLAGNAKARKDYPAALHWYEEAWRHAEGPATRLQWGTGYIGSLIELAPSDVGRIEQAARTLIAELQPTSETFYERNERALTRMSTRLVGWEGKDRERRQAVANIRRQLAAVCARLKVRDRGHGNCLRVLPAA